MFPRQVRLHPTLCVPIKVHVFIRILVGRAHVLDVARAVQSVTQSVECLAYLLWDTTVGVGITQLYRVAENG